ncbi:YbhB/YbcL family Raf kinase inhibitor-like protein [Arthrobacter sp. GCM10027362]|uniref:YbhB/YbcL family Raf kinase inhibitor-like protein n=1 Tax=Arthrobacter sp. GCM10027362 TaxID=3273379 RepID=UPI00363A9647
MPLNIQDLKVTVDEIEPGGRIPERFAADHGNETPKVSISGIPAGTLELALILHDPDAPLPNGFTHWVAYGISPLDGLVSGEVRLGPNGIGEASYTGPQPPSGHGIHHYYFWVYALDTRVEGNPSREEFLAAYAGNILEQARLVATFDA